LSSVVSQSVSQARGILLPILLPQSARATPLYPNARTARTHRLTALAVKKYAGFSQTELLRDGGGLYLRRREQALLWTLRL
jgi:hypothetical protein